MFARIMIGIYVEVSLSAHAGPGVTTSTGLVHGGR